MLICIEADAKICFGMVGTKRFCRSTGCRVKSHASKKFNMGCNAGWFLASKSQPLMGTPTAFITPFLDAFKITEDTREVLTNMLDRKTTEEWEEFIAEAKEEWEEVQAQCPWRGSRSNCQEDWVMKIVRLPRRIWNSRAPQMSLSGGGPQGGTHQAKGQGSC